MAHLAALSIRITGVVQGVGFRPFVYNLAARLGLSGWVLNSSAGVEIEVAGPPAGLDEFVARLRSEAPPLARVEQVEVRTIPVPADLFGGAFTIRHSAGRPGEFLPIPPDVALCDDCRRELLDPADRRYRYPFINCTHCGPRFTIIRDIPYDRSHTTMAPFTMCPQCQAEYDNPADRRFHAQPNACPACGPQITFHASRFTPPASPFTPHASPFTPHASPFTPPASPFTPPASRFTPPAARAEQALQEARTMLAAGGIVAIKGLGGFHLACDATDDAAVARLRERKGRVDKPFALMAGDVETVERLCIVSEEERRLLAARERPIVLLTRRPDSPISSLAAPGNPALGVMLPYTPLHVLLLEPAAGFPPALVMTSGNYSEEPIAVTNEEALERLANLADAFLLHDRDIHARCDDSVTRVFQGVELPIRRSRGYAPYPVHLPFPVRSALAVGGELKNTFCLTRERYAFLSQHIGDMENYETLGFFTQMVEQLARTFRVQPEVVACDLHPGYLSTRYAQELAAERGLPLVAVQHHHAHVAACMAEHGLDGTHPVIGVALDGTGYGPDGTIWGGEFLVTDYVSSRRVAHLKAMPLPGGDTAIRRPYRVALAFLWAAGLPWDEDLPPVAACPPAEQAVLRRQLECGLNVVATSSAGRLFDAVAALAGVRQEVNYEAQAAIELEGLVTLPLTPPRTSPPPEAGGGKDLGGKQVPLPASGGGWGRGLCTTSYEFSLINTAGVWIVDPTPVLHAVVADVRAGVLAGAISARFHAGLAQAIAAVCRRLRGETGLGEVALSGGVFQNVTLLGQVVPLLREAGFAVYTHHLVPPNDAGISLGQAMVAADLPPPPEAGGGEEGVA